MSNVTGVTGGHITVEAIVKRWESQDRPLFKGSLISDDGCCCAQGDVLRCAGRTDDYLRDISQCNADREVAKILGISVCHSILLQQINDSREGSPQDVLASPEKILGPHAGLVLSFWRRLDSFDWAAAGAAASAAAGAVAGAAAGAAASAAASAAAGNAARAAAWAAARAVAGAAARAVAGAAAGASSEIQGHEILESLYFLPLFGLTIDDLKVDATRHKEISQ